MINGNKIRYLREDADMTQTEFAQKIGSSHVFVGYVERGIKPPSVALLKRIADVLGVTMDDLMTDTVM